MEVAPPAPTSQPSASATGEPVLDQLLSQLDPEARQAYWQALARFLRFETSKAEFEESVRAALGDKRALHNTFVCSLLRGALNAPENAHYSALQMPEDMATPLEPASAPELDALSVEHRSMSEVEPAPGALGTAPAPDAPGGGGGAAGGGSLKLSLKIKMDSSGTFAAVTEPPPEMTIDPEEEAQLNALHEQAAASQQWAACRAFPPATPHPACAAFGLPRAAARVGARPSPTCLPPAPRGEHGGPSAAEPARIPPVRRPCLRTLRRLTDTARGHGVARVSPEAASFMRARCVTARVPAEPPPSRGPLGRGRWPVPPGEAPVRFPAPREARASPRVPCHAGKSPSRRTSTGSSLHARTTAPPAMAPSRRGCGLPRNGRPWARRISATTGRRPDETGAAAARRCRACKYTVGDGACTGAGTTIWWFRK